MDTNFEKMVKERLQRIETRMVNAFVQMDVDPCAKVVLGEVEIDERARVLYITDLSTTIGSALGHLRMKGYDPHEFSIVYRGAYPTTNPQEHEPHVRYPERRIRSARTG